MRSEFEKPEDIKERLKHCYFNKDANSYFPFSLSYYASAAYLNGAWSNCQKRQTEVDELQKQTIDQGQRFNEQAQHIKDLEHKSVELQKRVDAAQRLLESWKDEVQEGYMASDCVDKLEQALKGGVK